ncbi:MAG: molybdopterin converting factor small subunit [Pirellulaceae bacterium]|jgi:molybdopterin converting factor small subunit
MKIQVVVTGRSYHLADDIPEEIELAADATLNTAISDINSRLGDQPLPDSCLLAVGGKHMGTIAQHADVALRDGDEIVLIAPVAGG